MRAVLVVLGMAVTAGPTFAAAPTFTKDVAPIFYKSCVECHRPDAMAPMPLVAMIGISARPVSRAALDKIHRTPRLRKAGKAG